MKRLLYVFECGPYSTGAGLEALDAALIGASFDQKVSLLFLHDGVFQLKTGQTTDRPKSDIEVGHDLPLKPQLKQYTKIFKALEDFDINDVYVHDLSMAARGLTQSDLLIDVVVIDSVSVKKLIAEQNKVFTF